MLLNPSAASDILSSNGVDVSELLGNGHEGDDGLSQELQSLRLHEEALKSGISFDPLLDEPPGLLFVNHFCYPATITKLIYSAGKQPV